MPRDHLPPEQKVVGSNPTGRTKIQGEQHLSALEVLHDACLEQQADGRLYAEIHGWCIKPAGRAVPE